MPNVVVVYHSGFGHTEVLAERIAAGAAAVDGVEASLIPVADLPDPAADRSLGGRWPELDAADAIVFGSPTYMGSVSAGLKRVLEASSGTWFQQTWKDKLAGGFTNGGSFSGDKLNALQDIQQFCMQHSMIWVSLGLLPGKRGPDDINRIGATTGVMGTSDNESPTVTPPEGDRKTAELYGQRIAEACVRWSED
ncbi:MAG: flavodoxin family protein [Planctomycetota bacterium]